MTVLGSSPMIDHLLDKSTGLLAKNRKLGDVLSSICGEEVVPKAFRMELLTSRGGQAAAALSMALMEEEEEEEKAEVEEVVVVEEEDREVIDMDAPPRQLAAQPVTRGMRTRGGGGGGGEPSPQPPCGGEERADDSKRSRSR